MIALIASVAIAIGALLDWSAGPIGLNSTHLMVSSLINPFKYTKQHGPYVGWFLLALAGVGLIAAFVRGGRVWRVPVGLAASAFAVLYVGQTMRMLDKVPSHPSFTKLIGPGPWIVVFAGFALAASVFFSAEERAPIGRWINVASVVIVVGVCAWALTNGSLRTPSFALPSGSSPGGKSASVTDPAKLPHADPCKVVSAKEVTKVFASHSAYHTSTIPNFECDWRSGLATTEYHLDVIVVGGTHQFDLDETTEQTTPITGVGERAFFLVNPNHTVDLWFVKHNQTVGFVYSQITKGSSLQIGVFDTNAVRDRLTAIGRVVASRI